MLSSLCNTQKYIMQNHIAIIDLGTNTCNLLIAEFCEKSHRILFQGKEVVKLGKGGIDKNHLTQDGLDRAILAIRNHRQRINEFHTSEILILATSAIREATNKDQFCRQIKLHTGLELQIISGEREADLILKGVKLAFGIIEDNSLILDIGGGSNEFILTQGNESVWKESFPLGMARVIEKIPPSDPITSEEIQEMNQWFNSKLEPLWGILKNVRISQLIGCSGAFDTLADILDQTNPGSKSRIRQDIRLHDFERIYELLVKSKTSDRMLLKGMEPIRIEMIVPSVIFIKLIIDRLNIQKITQTDYALREGVLYERIFS